MDRAPSSLPITLLSALLAWSILPAAADAAGPRDDTAGDPGVAYTPDSIDLERALFEYLATRPEDRSAAARTHLERMAARAIRAEPTYTFQWYLLAYLCRVEGDTARERAILDNLGHDTDGWYHVFFERPEREVMAYMRSHLVHDCIRRDDPGKVPAFFWRGGTPPPDVFPRCGGLEVDPMHHPWDYSLYERLTLRSRGLDRLRLWTPDGQWVDMDTFAAEIGVVEGARVADVGAGMGYFAVPFARIVGPTGRLYGVELDAMAIELLGALAEYHGRPQLVGVRGEPDHIGLEPSSVDVIWICDTLKVILREERIVAGKADPLLDSFHDALRSRGRLVIAEKPDREAEEPHPVTMDALTAAVEAAGFEHEVTLPAFLPDRHVMVFRRGKARR